MQRALNLLLSKFAGTLLWWLEHASHLEELGAIPSSNMTKSWYLQLFC